MAHSGFTSSTPRVLAFDKLLTTSIHLHIHKILITSIPNSSSTRKSVTPTKNSINAARGMANNDA